MIMALVVLELYEISLLWFIRGVGMVDVEI